MRDEEVRSALKPSARIRRKVAPKRTFILMKGDFVIALSIAGLISTLV